MYKTLFIFLLITTVTANIFAQVTISLQVPPTGVMQKSQLWNMVLVNTSETPLRLYVGLSLLSAKDNRPVMTATTRAFILAKGAKQLSLSEISPIQYNFLSSVFDVDRSPDGLLPIGNYKACYTVYRTEKTEQTPLAEDCLPVEVQPLSPPLLNTPADADTISTPYPQFTWLPAIPVNLFSNLNYDLILVEVLPGQTKGEAIQKNLPLFNMGYCKTPFNNYPASNKSLDTGRLYAWKIIAKNEDDFVAESETWTFRIKPVNKVLVPVPTESYAVLDNELEGVYQVKGERLLVKYYSFEKSDTSNIFFVDQAGQIIYQQKQILVTGDNYMSFSIGKRFEPGKQYQLLLIGLDNKKHVLNFTILKNQ